MDAADQGKEVHVDLKNQTISYDENCLEFEVEEFRRHCLLNGLDDIGLTLQKVNEIAKFENFLSKERPWL